MAMFPEVRVGAPIRQQALSVFPLFSNPQEPITYVLSDEAIAAGAVTVEEVSEGGSVPHLKVKNAGTSRVLFLEGEQLQGAKQNRVLNTSVLVAAGSTTSIPVSCVEQGRWRYRSRQFATSDHYSSSKLRRLLKKSVTDSLKKGEGHTSDQGAVWGEVSRQMCALSASSETHAMDDTYAAHQRHLDEYRQKFGYVDGATGMTVAVGNQVVAVDLFDKPETCKKVWDRLLSGVVMDALEAKEPERPVEAADVESFLSRFRDVPWEPAPAVGEGHEQRFDSDENTHASALVCEGSMVHGSVVVASV